VHYWAQKQWLGLRLERPQQQGQRTQGGCFSKPGEEWADGAQVHPGGDPAVDWGL